MKEAHYFYVPDALNAGLLPDDEAKHAQSVLRLSSGDEVFLLDGVGGSYKAQLTEVSRKKCCYKILEKIEEEKTWKGNFHLAIAPTKSVDRIEWMAEKLTEVGFDSLSFLDCKFSERHVIRTDRIERIVVSAMKQSRKAWKPLVNEILKFSEFLRSEHQGLMFIAHCYDEIERYDLTEELINRNNSEQQQSSSAASRSADITVLVGPEGDFSVDEVREAIDCGFIPVSLGNSRLRTETAGFVSIMKLHMAEAFIKIGNVSV